jgi:hypothetical protein
MPARNPRSGGRAFMGNLAMLQPILSPILWNSVATGNFADKRGIDGFPVLWRRRRQRVSA